MTDRERRYQEAVDAQCEDAEDARREILREERDTMVDPDDETLCDCGEDKRPDDPACEECMQCAVDDTLDYRAGRIGR